ncbi:telomerase reverse transcriptase PWA37_004474 [Arxiozyma heterogenica]|uniref:Telomerase reverse transcriptase n=1 Tax=Arxiozyma heterogenica TaxID=278026 RepID=A0AAN7W5C6_9SACH|nr:hypothetical protein RI543_000763 [Kazachstania heterogenica]
MLSLQEFFKVQEIEKEGFTNFGDLKYVNKNILQFETFLKSTFVLRNANKIELSTIPIQTTYEEVIDFVIGFLLQNNFFNNVLVFGFKRNHQNDVNKSFFSYTPNRQIQELKTIHWRMLFDIVGISKFMDLMINFSVFQLDGKKWKQILGNQANKPTVPPSWLIEDSTSKQIDMISLKHFLHRNYTKFGTFDPLINRCKLDDLRRSIFCTWSINLTKRQKIEINTQLNLLIRNCSNRKNNYFSMLNYLCPVKSTGNYTSHLDLQTPKKNVVRLVILVLEKLIPLSMFGSKHNKSKIFKGISALINLPLNGVLYINDLISKVRMKEIIYLYTGTDRDNHKRSQILFKNFVLWLLTSMVPRIIKSFFYCTEISSLTDIVYFRHDIWQRLTTPFISEYFNKYLFENTVCRNHNSYLLSEFNHNRIRVIPKKANGEFRVIAIPSRGADEEEHLSYKINRLKVVIPMQAILNYLRYKRATDFEKVSSPFQVANKLLNFKNDLIKQHNTLPELYFMKFDVASCYDSIPRKKLFSVIKALLQSETNFYVKSYTVYNPTDGRLKIKHIVNDDKGKVSEKLYINNNQEFFFTVESILDAIKFELFKTALWIDDKCYLRKDGIFQGSSYSPLLVDILYDDMIQSFKQFRCREGHQLLIIRIADDFLIVSTDKDQIMEIRDLAVLGFGDYNAVAKKEKIVVVDSRCTLSNHRILSFCGLNIDVSSLEIWKSKESLNIPIINNPSTIKTYKRILDLFRLRLEYRTLNGALNSLETIQNQIDIFMDNISSIFIKAFDKKKVRKDAFLEFIHNLFTMLLEYSYNIKILETEYITIVKKILFEKFIYYMKLHKIKYFDIIESLAKGKTLL